MMSSMVWSRLILSPITLYTVSNVTLCYRVTWYCSRAKRVVIVPVSYRKRTVGTL
jgi:hypothetical protein